MWLWEFDRAQPNGHKLSELQTAAGARVRKKPQRLEAELFVEPSLKRAKRAGGGTKPKATTAALKRSEQVNEQLKAKLKDAQAKIK